MIEHTCKEPSLRQSGRVEVRAVDAEAIPDIASIHLAGFPGSALARLGEDAVRRYYEWIVLGPHDSQTLGAFDDGRIIGFIIGGVFRGAHGGFVRKNRGFLIRRVILQPWLLRDPLFRDRIAIGVRSLLHRFRRRKPVVATASTRVYSLLSMAVHPEHRGVSALLLIQESERVAARLGFDEVASVVHTSDLRMIKFYQSLGYKRNLENGVWKGEFRRAVQPANRNGSEK